jgi:hypothetical protein
MITTKELQQLLNTMDGNKKDDSMGIAFFDEINFKLERITKRIAVLELSLLDGPHLMSGKPSRLGQNRGI